MVAQISFDFAAAFPSVAPEASCWRAAKMPTVRHRLRLVVASLFACVADTSGSER